jgi:hypothetical protein
VKRKLSVGELRADERLGDIGTKRGRQRLDAAGCAPRALGHYGGGGGVISQARGQPGEGWRCDVGHVNWENDNFVR